MSGALKLTWEAVWVLVMVAVYARSPDAFWPAFLCWFGIGLFWRWGASRT
jgi:hypothetical protein